MNILHVPQFLRPHECLDTIQWATELGFAQARVKTTTGLVQMLNVRNNDKVEQVNLARTEMLRQRALTKNIHSEKEYWNPLLRVYRYGPGQVFKTHKDGIEHVNGMMSFKTILIYLNTTDGGETIFMPNGKNDPASYRIVTPRQGDMVIFDHQIWHEARTVHSGLKFVLRSDLMHEP